MKRMKKLLGLLIALILCFGGYAAVQNMNETTTVTEEEVSLPLIAHTADELTGMEWTVNDTSFSFTKAADGWQVTGDAAYPVEQEEVTQLGDTLLGMTAFRELTNITNPADYGLENANFTLTATWSDGSQTIYTMGMETPFGDGWYLSLGESGIAYAVDKNLSSTFDVTLSELTAKEAIPTVETATRVIVGELDVSKADDTEIWTAADGTVLDSAKVDDLIANIEAVDWDELVTAKADDLAVYSLDDETATAITLHGAGASSIILLGSTDEAGDYYARLPDSTMVYTVAADTVSDILSSDVDSLWSNALITLSAEKVATATFTAGDKVYAYDAETGADLWSDIVSLTAKSRLTEAPAGAVILTVDVTDTEGNAISLTICEHSVDEYAAAMDGRYSLVSADTVDKLIRTVKSLAQ